MSVAPRITSASPAAPAGPARHDRASARPRQAVSLAVWSAGLQPRSGVFRPAPDRRSPTRQRGGRNPSLARRAATVVGEAKEKKAGMHPRTPNRVGAVPGAGDAAYNPRHELE